MRTIVVTLFTAALAAAQPQLADLEKQLAADPGRLGVRTQILNRLSDPGVAAAMPYDTLIETRRRHILWLIQNHPESRESFLHANQLIPPRGFYADPQGYAESVRLWKEIASSPGASTEVVANAAIYLKATDRPLARALLDSALKRYPENPALWHALGIVDAAAVAGFTGEIFGAGGPGQFEVSAALRESPEATAARQEIESSHSAFLLGGAAGIFTGTVLIRNQFQLSFGDDDPTSLSERWLRRAIELAPNTEQFRTQLSPVLRTQANRSEDPRERARLFAEALKFAPENQKPALLADLANAEFEAGDDEGARRDAQRALDGALEVFKRNGFDGAALINRGNSVLGRIALAHGDAVQARALLRASLEFPGQANVDFRFAGPDLSLAQDLADTGERDAVIDYLETSRKFWPYDRGLVDRYIKSLKAGKKREAFVNFPHPSFEIVNRPAPPFNLHEPGGKEWTLKSIAGKRAALLFWNASCQSCARQIAEFAKAAEATDVRLLAVNIGDDDPAVRAFADRNHVTATVVEANRTVAQAWRADTYPSVAVIDADGRIAQYQVGAAQNPRQTLESGALPVIAKPVPLEAARGAQGLTVAWRPVPGAVSYVVEWETRDKKGWPSDHDGFLHAIPTRDTHVEVACPGEVRWRVFAVAFGSPGEATAWQPFRALQ
jgi:peroxiredoxin